MCFLALACKLSVCVLWENAEKTREGFWVWATLFFLTVRSIQALSLVFFPHLHVSVPPFDYHLGDLLSAIIDFPPNMCEDFPFMV